MSSRSVVCSQTFNQGFHPRPKTNTNFIKHIPAVEPRVYSLPVLALPFHVTLNQHCADVQSERPVEISVNSLTCFRDENSCHIFGTLTYACYIAT